MDTGYAIQNQSAHSRYKARSHDPKQVMSHKGEGDMKVTKHGHQSVCVCVWSRNARGVALSTVNLQLLRCLNKKRKTSPYGDCAVKNGHMVI